MQLGYFESVGVEMFHTVKLMYLRGSLELHALAETLAANEGGQERLTWSKKNGLHACRQDYKSVEQLVGGKGERLKLTTKVSKYQQVPF